MGDHTQKNSNSNKMKARKLYNYVLGESFPWPYTACLQDGDGTQWKIADNLASPNVMHAVYNQYEHTV